MNTSNVITNIESKTQATRLFSFKDLLFFITYLIIAYIFKGRVNDILVIPYIIFSAFMGGFLLLPSTSNNGRNNMESIYLLFFADNKVYKPYYYKRGGVELENEEENKPGEDETE